MTHLPSIFIITLGCPKNVVDSEIMAGLLIGNGFSLVKNPKEADVIVINTCGFIKEAKEESLEAIFEAIDLKISGKCKGIIVAGCLSQRYFSELRAEIPEVDAFIGLDHLDEVVHCIKSIPKQKKKDKVSAATRLYDHNFPRANPEVRHYRYLKISDGCNHRCSYCAIPLIRGDLRSRNIESLIIEAQNLEINGAKELILVAQDCTAFGEDQGKKELKPLLQMILTNTSIPWVRLLYLHPAGITEDLVDFIAQKKRILKYFDIPIQHIDQAILKAMRRKISETEIRKKLKWIKESVPEATLRTTLMVGFPGETESAFKKLYDFVAEAEFDRLGVFAYSPEEGTNAFKILGKVSEKIKKERMNKIMQLQAEISLKKNKRLVGKIEQAIIDDRDNSFIFARLKSQAPEIDGILIIDQPDGEQKDKSLLKVGDFIKARITEAEIYDLKGSLSIGRANPKG